MTTKRKPAAKKAAPKRKPAKITAVTIARDALSLLTAKKLIAESGVYTEPSNKTSARAIRSLASDGQLQPVFQMPTFKCRVCALGALFVAVVIRNNDATFQDFDEQAPMQEVLNPWFDTDQLYLIERAFEGKYHYRGSPAQQFASRYKADKTRLKVILENVIKNRGEFILPEMESEEA